MGVTSFQHHDAYQLRLRGQGGRHEPAAITERRMALICAERGISDAELQKYRGSRKNSKVFNYHRFCEDHRVSIAWLLDGDLRGLYLMSAGLELDGSEPTTPLVSPAIPACGEWLQRIARAEIERALNEREAEDRP